MVHTYRIGEMPEKYHTHTVTNLDISLKFAVALDTSKTVVVAANWYQFGDRERIENTLVESRMLLWCRSGQGFVQMEIDGQWWPLAPDDFLFLPWRHRVVYKADADHPFFVGGIHLVPHHDKGYPVELGASHHPDDNLAGLPWRRDEAWSGLEGLVHGTFSGAERLRLLATYTVERLHGVRPSEPVMRELGRLLVDELWLAVMSRHAGQEPAPAALRQMQEYARAHLNVPHTVSTLARIGGCSPATATRLFRRFTNEAPHRWLARQRIEQATLLLRSSALPVSEVGERVGFKDPFHFSRFFKRYVGRSPQAYRNDRQLF